MLSRKTLVIGIILIAVLGISACIETNHEVEAPVAVTSANEPTDANNQVGVTPVADTSADERSPVWSPDRSKIAVVTMKLRESGSDRDIYMIDMPATEDVKNENHT